MGTPWWKRVLGTAGKVGLEVGVPLAETLGGPIVERVVERLMEATQHHGEKCDVQSFLKNTLPIVIEEVGDVAPFTPRQIAVIKALIEVALKSDFGP